MSDVLTNMQLVKEGKLICKQNKCRFYHNCDNYNCSYLELAEPKDQTNEKYGDGYYTNPIPKLLDMQEIE